MTHGGQAVVLAALMTMLLGGGCVGDVPEPVKSEAAETTTAAPAPSPSPSPMPTNDLTVRPTPPAAMTDVNADGAVAAASYAIDVLNHAAVIGDPKPWRSVSAPTCRICAAFADGIAESGPDTDAPLVVTEAHGRALATDELYSVELTVTQEPSADGSNPGGTFLFFVALSHDSEWRVEAIDISES